MDSGLKFGVFDHMDRGADNVAAFFENRLKLIERYDEVGIRTYHVAEHHATPLGMASSPSVFLSAVAQRTKHLRFGPLVYCLPLYHPVRLLEEICMLDQMSNGRFELGVGKGISPIEHGFFDSNYDEGSAIYREALELILTGLANDRLTYEGDRFQVKDMPMRIRPVQQPHPPLWYGLHTPKSVAWPAENRVNVVTNTPVHIAREITDGYREVYEAAGHPMSELPLLGMTRYLVIGNTEEEALAAARRAYPKWRDSFMKLWVENNRDPIGVSYPETFDGVIESGQGFAGTPDQVGAAIQEQCEGAGVNYFIGRFAFGDLSLEESLRSVNLFAEHIMPSLRQAA